MSLESIRERATRATPGPWDWEGGPVNRLGSEFDEVIEPVYRDTRCLVSVGTADAAFIAHARQDIPALLRVAEAAARDMENCAGCKADERGYCYRHNETGPTLRDLDALP